jgi:hypothetical protein
VAWKGVRNSGGVLYVNCERANRIRKVSDLTVVGFGTVTLMLFDFSLVVYVCILGGGSGER